MPNVSEYLFERVADLGVRHVFLIPGGGCMHLVDALARQSRIEPVALLHEQSVGVAAEAYGQFRDAPGVALVTTGPGGTNALTAVAAAWLDSTPVLFISGQVKTSDLVGQRGVRQFGFQEIDIVSMVRPITKEAILLHDPADAPEVIARLLELTRAGRPGPVWLDIPLDVQTAELGSHLPAHRGAWRPSRPDAPSWGDIDDVVAAFRGSERPLILAGNGVRLAGGVDVLVEFAHRQGIPLTTTWKALDLVAEVDPLFAGRPGGIASRYANFAQQTCDFLLVIGARLDLGQTGYRHDTFAPLASKVVVDIDPFELQKLDIPRMRPICCDAATFVSALAARLQPPEPTRWRTWRERITAWRDRYPLFDPGEREWDDGVSVYSLIEVMSRLMTPLHIFVPGSSGACSEVSMQSFQVKKGQRVLNSEGLGPMGFGIPAAIGACLASGGRPTVCVDGDGGFAMNLQDLVSAQRMGLPTTFVILDNGGYGSIRATQDGYFEGRRVACDPESGLALPDYVAVARAMGVVALRISTISEFEAAFEESLGRSDPTVIVATVSPRQVTRPRVVSRRRPDGGMTTDVLEDLTPKLDAAELRRELYGEIGGGQEEARR